MSKITVEKNEDNADLVKVSIETSRLAANALVRVLGGFSSEDCANAYISRHKSQTEAGIKVEAKPGEATLGLIDLMGLHSALYDYLEGDGSAVTEGTRSFKYLMIGVGLNRQVAELMREAGVLSAADEPAEDAADAQQDAAA